MTGYHAPEDDHLASMAATHVRYRIAQFPGPGFARENPYRRLFYGALEPYGVHCVGTLSLSDAWIRAHAPDIDAIHIHWPEELWRLDEASRVRSLRRVIRLSRALRAFNALHIKRIWTVHNLEHHEEADWVDRYGYRVLARRADLLICHSRHAARAMTALYRPRGRVVVMPHGNYAGVYPPARPRAEVLRELGLRSDRPTVCVVGAIRRYKGIELGIEGIARLQGAVQLIVAGRPQPSDYLTALKADIDRLEGAVLIGRRMSEQEFADVVGASDGVILSYRQVTTSGALLGALTLGRGVIASRIPYFEETLEPEPEAGTLFAPGDAAALAAAVESYFEVPAERRAAAARRLAARYAWGRCIIPVATVFERWQREQDGRAAQR